MNDDAEKVGTADVDGDLVASAQIEVEERVHDRVSPDAMLDPLAVVSLYVEAFVAGARFAVETRHDRDPKGA